jgi:hypothetical protein
VKKISGPVILAVALVLTLAFAAACGRAARPSGTGAVIGVKIYEHPGPYGPLVDEWRGLGIDTVFAGESLARNADFRRLVRSTGLTLFLIFPVFQSPEAVKADPGLAAVTAAGTPARDEWVEFVCPAREDFLARRVEELRSAVAAADPDVVSLDFIRYFVFWEKVAPSRTPGSLPQTCFCPVCLAGFEKDMGVRVPAELATTPEKADWILACRAAEWTEWKCRTIARAVERLAAAARAAKPGVRINLHAVPWREADFGGAAASVAGQDLARLAPLVDLISPMAYHHMVGRDPAWVHSVVADFVRRTEVPVLASIQVSEAYIEAALSPAEFRAALAEALKPPSIGVVLWSWDALSKSPEKKDILRSAAALKNKPR